MESMIISKGSITSDESVIKIELTSDNLSKFPMEILYYKEQGFTKFLLEYKFDKLRIPISKVAEKIKTPLLKTVQNYDIVVFICGFPRSIFEKVILKPNMRWKLEKKIKYVELEMDETFDQELEVPLEYVEKFGDKEIKPLVMNSELVEKYEEEVENFESNELKDIAKKIIEDYANDEHYLRKRIVFVRSYPSSNPESYKERVVYYINNREDDYKETMNFIQSFFSKKEMQGFEKLLTRSNEFVISFAVMSDGLLRRSFYFYKGDITDEEMQQVGEELGVKIDSDKDLAGIGIDYKEDKQTVKLYYKYSQINKDEVKQFFSEFPLENKRKIFSILNSCTKPLNDVFLDYKMKEGKVISRRVDISLQHNSFKLHQLSNLLSEGLGFLGDKELYTLSFEATHDNPEKINFYYALKPDEDEEELEERPRFQ